MADLMRNSLAIGLGRSMKILALNLRSTASSILHGKLVAAITETLGVDLIPSIACRRALTLLLIPGSSPLNPAKESNSSIKTTATLYFSPLAPLIGSPII